MQYQIIGEPLPVVECQLAQGETMITERGSMCDATCSIDVVGVKGGK